MSDRGARFSACLCGDPQQRVSPIYLTSEPNSLWMAGLNRSLGYGSVTLCMAALIPVHLC